MCCNLPREGATIRIRVGTRIRVSIRIGILFSIFVPIRMSIRIRIGIRTSIRIRLRVRIVTGIRICVECAPARVGVLAIRNITIDFADNESKLIFRNNIWSTLTFSRTNDLGCEAFSFLIPSNVSFRAKYVCHV